MTSAGRHPVQYLARPQSPVRPVLSRGAANAPFAIDDLAGEIKLDVLLLPGFDLRDLAIAEEIATAFNRQSSRHRMEFGIRTVSQEPVLSSCGIRIAADPFRSTAPNLLILGGAVLTSSQYSPWWFCLRRACYESARIFSDAGGTFALASAGLLDGHVASAPWRSAAAWRALAPNVRFMAGEWMAGQKFHSCLGGRSLALLLLQCVSRQFGAAAGRDVARDLNVEIGLYEASRSGLRSHLPARCHPALRDAVEAIHCNLEMPLKIGGICAAAGGVSERTLQRLFRHHLGTTIYGYYRACRLEHARDLLRLTLLSVTEVALMAGFESPTHFSQCYRNQFGCPPGRDR